MHNNGRRPLRSRIQAGLRTIPPWLIVGFCVSTSFYVYSVSEIGHAKRFRLIGELIMVTGVVWTVAAFQRREVLGALIGGAIPVFIYAATYLKLTWLGEAISVVDVRSLGVLFEATPNHVCATVVIPVVLIIGLAIWNFAWPTWTRLALVLATPVAFASATGFAPSHLHRLIEGLVASHEMTSPHQLHREGPLVFITRNFVQVRQFTGSVTPKLNAAFPYGDADAVRPIDEPPNIYLILLESQLDPLHFKEASYHADPVDRRVRTWWADSASYTLSPVYGGQTARAEFEVLCGLPSFGDLGVDFFLLNRPGLPCLPTLLAKVGYQTIAINGNTLTHFNRHRAYASIGFSNLHLEDEFDTSDVDGIWLSPQASYLHAQRFIAAARADGKPQFTYVLTSGNHYPFALNPERRPTVIDGDSEYQRAANPAHYNTQYAGDFVEELERRDPHALIVLFGDHLPSMREGYQTGLYRHPLWHDRSEPFWNRTDGQIEMLTTPLIVRHARRTIPVGVIPQYLLGEVILDRITGGHYCRMRSCAFQRDVHYRPFGGQMWAYNAQSRRGTECHKERVPKVCNEIRERHERLRELWLSMIARGQSAGVH